MKLKKFNENSNDKIQSFYDRYKSLCNDDDYTNYEIFTEIGQLTLKYDLSKEDVKYILDNLDCSFDIHKFLEDIYQNWDGDKTLPTKTGWYWVLIDGYDDPTPCWYSYNSKEPEDSYFLPGGMGDSSSMGLYLDDIEKIGPEIEVPNF